MIRPPDPAITGTTLRYMPIGSADAVRRLVHRAFRDCVTAIDLTYSRGRFWTDPLPPGLTLTTNNLDPSSGADLHLDFTSTGLSDSSYDLVTYDPPHIADGGKNGILARRFGTVRGIDALRDLVQAGTREAWRIAALGILVKVADHAHQGEHQPLSDWVKAAVPTPLYTELHTFRPVHPRDGKHRVTRVPRSNGAAYLVFRRTGDRHIDFDRLYARQQATAAREEVA
jgi:hypothetical protein